METLRAQIGTRFLLCTQSVEVYILLPMAGVQEVIFVFGCLGFALLEVAPD